MEEAGGVVRRWKAGLMEKWVEPVTDRAACLPGFEQSFIGIVQQVGRCPYAA
ncbi:MAG: hypothetical protein AVDCRST_MAG56-959 [uncultured Cytophagales bacterium]|uniref:Uncharacterized protein n=1 Tax=uncultured Cytophagales bacterium TaxID=158755 RepID=A0A6J4HJK2_9SPHI|nr:MAG: hypothetical protein AVDCRST_MAG56-959 [uncultured Cytophagales bacterium]